MTSWTYEDENELRIPSDKIKVSCENIEEDGSGDWHNAEILHESAKGEEVMDYDYDIDNVPIWVKVRICYLLNFILNKV